MSAPLNTNKSSNINSTPATNSDHHAAEGSMASLFYLDLSTDGYLLLLARFVRLFSYGWISVVLMMYLVELGLDQFYIGVLFAGTLFGDLIITFFLTTTADGMIGRKTTLLIGSILKIFAGCMYAFQSNFYALLVAGIVGIISPTGGEIGPFLAVEQSSLTESITRLEHISVVFGWYQFLGYLAQAFGALASGLTIMSLQVNHGWSALAAYRFIVIGYGFFGGVKFLIYWFLSPAIEPLHARDVASTRDWFGSKFGLHRAESRTVVFKLSMLFILDAFAGGFVMQTIIVYWFKEEYALTEDRLGEMMMGANLFAGLSALAATPLVNRIGAIPTMVFTHLPSNILLLMIPFMPNATLAVIILLLRFSISQMDVPARQTYVAMVVDADERSAAGGITSIVRSIGLSASPLLAGYLLADPENSIVFSLPFIVAGGLKCLYDILLYISFKTTETSGESKSSYAPVGGPSVIGVGAGDARVTQEDTNLYDEEFDQEHPASRK